MSFFFLSRLGDEAFCRRLTLEGWDRLVMAEEGGGVILVSPGDDLWPLTVAAVGLYRGPVVVVAGASRLRRLPARWRRRFVGRSIEPDDIEKAVASLRGGGRVVVVDKSSVAARLTEESGATVLSAVAESPRRGRYRVVLRKRL